MAQRLLIERRDGHHGGRRARRLACALAATALLLPVHALPVHALPIHALPIHALPIHALPAHALPGQAASALADHGRLPGLATAGQAREQLDALTVGQRGSLAGYSHSSFMPEWAAQEGTCDTRETVLLRDGHGVQADADCRPVAGTWESPYDGRTLTSSDQIDVDHVVPLANAWRSGADSWSPERRRAFANDLTRPELVVVSESVNLDKGGRTPVTWRPPRTAYWCTYARAWIGVKHHYGLRVTEAEKSALTDMLATCSP
ncbi:HNH endonuclease family protein [Nonomuraea sp. NPDC023979]|uniref:HNH endonuclease family protein n=1 Tax=Nonomuraea sp. NPDC023979 TaxID=3154796 RepID=UPI0033E8118E